MRVFFSIIINAFILYAITYLLWPNELKQIESWVILWCGDCSYSSIEAWQTYFIWWIILWIINVTIKPVLKILSLPIFFVFFGLAVFVINAIILKLFDYIVNDLLIIDWIAYTIQWWSNFIIAVAIFTILNIFYWLIFSKK